MVLFYSQVIFHIQSFLFGTNLNLYLKMVASSDCDSQNLPGTIGWLRCVLGRFLLRVECPTFQSMHLGTSTCRLVRNTGKPQLLLPSPSGNGESRCSSGSSSESGLCWGSEDRKELSSIQWLVQLLLVPSSDLIRSALTAQRF